MKIIQISIFTFLLVSFSGGYASTKQSNNSIINSDEWNGWRGLEKEGVLESSNIPVQWDTKRNMKWKTKVIGKGYSSPIVSDDSIFITTAYESTKWKIIKKCFKLFTYIFALVSFLFFLNYLTNHRLNIFKINLTFFYIFSGYIILFGFIFFGRSIINYSDSIDVRSWLALSFQLVLCVFLISMPTFEKSQRIFIGIVSILFSILCLIGIPPYLGEIILKISYLKQTSNSLSSSSKIGVKGSSCVPRLASKRQKRM